MKRTKAQRRWNRKGYYWEHCPLKPQSPNHPRYTYLLGKNESWRASREFGILIRMPVRRVAEALIHNGKKFK